MRLSNIQHKKLYVSGAIALLILIIGVSASYRPVVQIPETPAETTQAAAVAKSEVDSDGDGLPDWKEALYGSDIYLSDTDGDGTSDGDEVRVGRDPSKKSPNDALSFLQDPEFATSSTDVEGIKKEFYAGFLAERGNEIRETTFQDLVAKVDTGKFKPKYEHIGLNIQSNNDPEAIREYLNAFGRIIDAYTSVKSHPKEEDILAAAFKSKLQSDFDQLQLPVITYRNLVRDLRKLPAPSVFANAQLLIVNGYEGMATGLMSMQQTLVDPLDGAAGYEAYLKYQMDVNAGFFLIIDYLFKNEIDIAASEPGYYFSPSRFASSTIPSPEKDLPITP
jgi:hypothetical protein